MKVDTESELKHTYFIPKLIAKAMMKVDLRTQCEAQIMSMSFMLLGLIVTGIYIAIYVNFPLWYKIFLIINLIAGMFFFITSIVQSFQQYLNIMEVMDFDKEQENFNKEQITKREVINIKCQK